MASRTPSTPRMGSGDPLSPAPPQTPTLDSGPTLLEILQRPNPPTTDKLDGKSRPNARSEGDNLDVVALDDENPGVQEWADFTFPAIQLAYGHILHKKMRALESRYREPLTPSPGQKVGVIVNEASVDKYGIDWTRQIVRAPIRAAGAQLRPAVSHNVGTDTSAGLFHQCIEWGVPTQKGATLKPDWVSRVSFRPARHLAAAYHH